MIVVSILGRNKPYTGLFCRVGSGCQSVRIGSLAAFRSPAAKFGPNFELNNDGFIDSLRKPLDLNISGALIFGDYNETDILPVYDTMADCRLASFRDGGLCGKYLGGQDVHGQKA